MKPNDENFIEETRYKDNATTSKEFDYLLSLNIKEIEKRKKDITNELGSTEQKMEEAKKNLRESLWGDLCIGGLVVSGIFLIIESLQLAPLSSMILGVFILVGAISLYILRFILIELKERNLNHKIQELEFIRCYKLGYSDFQKGDFRSAISHYKSALQILPNYVDVLNDIGSALSNAGEREKALSYFEKALKINPNFLTALINYGNTLLKLKRYDQAIEQINKALVISPTSRDAWFIKGDIYSAKWEDKKAVKCYKKALEENADDLKILIALGAGLSNAGELEEALPYFDKVLDMEPKNSLVLSNKGITLRKLNRDDDAINSFKDALVHDPLDLKTLFNMARSYSKINNVKDTLKTLEKIDELDPTYMGTSLFTSDFDNIKRTEKFRNLILKQGYGIPLDYFK